MKPSTSFENLHCQSQVGMLRLSGIGALVAIAGIQSNKSPHTRGKGSEAALPLAL